MKMPIFAFVAVCCVVPSQAFGTGHPDWRFTRQEGGGVSTEVLSLAEAGSDQRGETTLMDDEIFAFSETSVSASDSIPSGSAFAQSASMAQAMSLTPVGNAIFLPTVDTTISSTELATASGGLEARSGLMELDAIAQASSLFELEGTPTTGFLRGGIYLVGIVQESKTGDSNAFGDSSINARINSYGVSALYSSFTGLWTVNVNLPGVPLEYTTSGMNDYFEFTIPITLPAMVEIRAESIANGGAVAFGQGGQAQVQINLSASAWAVFTPTETPPPEGDFDGDLDVDGADFLAFQRGFGTNMGATLSQGDADQDGIVGASDLALWASNFGTTSIPSGPATLAVPEPTALQMLGVIATLLVCNRSRSTQLE